MIKALENLSNRITVNYEEKPCYDIVFSDSFTNLLVELEKFNIKNRKLCIVTESKVGPLYGEELSNLLKPHCKQIILHEFKAGEQYKNLDTINDIYEDLIVNKFDRNDMLLALGGGVTGDMTGYTAATYLRGIDFVQIPTTLLSQVDSSIGGKTGVDFKAYKNMVGAFYMPKLVYMNLSTLNSLPEREYLSGMGEVIKHGIIKDGEYFNWLKENIDGVLNKDYETLRQLLFVSCNIKRCVVENDPKEKGERALLNFGHTIGHAIEKTKNFSLLHGECVSIGINAASYISYKKGFITKDQYHEILDVLKLYKLPIETSDIKAKEVVEGTLNAKKRDSGIIKFIVANSIGEASINREISKNDLLESVKKVIVNE